MILRPNLITASVISQTKPEFYVTNLPTRNHIEIGVTFNPVLTAVEIRSFRFESNQSEIGATYSTNLTGGTLKSIRQDFKAVEKGVEVSTSITGVTLYTMKKDVFESEFGTVEFNTRLTSAELNSNLNRGYSRDNSDSVIYGIGLTGATLTQRNV